MAHPTRASEKTLAAGNERGTVALLDECPDNLRQWEWHYLRAFGPMRRDREPSLQMGVQPIVAISLDPISNVASSVSPAALNGVNVDEAAVAAAIDAWSGALSIPAKWSGLVLSHPETSGLRATWLYANLVTDTDGLARGESQNAFTIKSNDLPGIVQAEIAGNAGEGPSYNDDGPTGDIAQQLRQLQLHNFVGQLAAAPAVSVPVPFDRATLLRSIDAQVKTWIDLKILDAPTFSQIDRFIQAAIIDASRNDPRSCEASVENIRRILRTIYPLLDKIVDDSVEAPDSPYISRLATRVLIVTAAAIGCGGSSNLVGTTQPPDSGGAAGSTSANGERS